MLFVVLLLRKNILHNKIACNCILSLFNTQLIYQSSMLSGKYWSIFLLKIQWVLGIYTGIQVYIFVYKYIYIYYIYIYIYTIVSFVVKYTKCSMGRAKYHLVNGFFLKDIGRVHYSEFHVLDIHQVHISTSSKRKTKISMKQSNIKYTTINPYYLLHFWEVAYSDDGICLWILFFC